MRTVSYVSRRTMRRKGVLALVGGTIFGRRSWHEHSPLPLLRHVTLAHPALPPAFDGLVVAQLADLHAGLFMVAERVARVRSLVEAAKPDLVVLTGDQLDRRDLDADAFVQGLAGLEAPLGCFGVLGNHDHLAGRDLALAALEAVGVTALVNQRVTLRRGADRLVLAGVDDLDAPAPGPDFSVASTAQGLFSFLLCHQPRGWDAARAAGATVTLAGHTHGGQIALPSRGVNIARLQSPYLAGLYTEGEQLLYVSRGIGVGAVPVRLGSPPEVDLLTLRRAPLGAGA